MVFWYFGSSASGILVFWQCQNTGEGGYAIVLLIGAEYAMKTLRDSNAKKREGRQTEAQKGAIYVRAGRPHPKKRSKIFLCITHPTTHNT